MVEDVNVKEAVEDEVLAVVLVLQALNAAPRAISRTRNKYVILFISSLEPTPQQDTTR
jgi:hypothetical protein